MGSGSSYPVEIPTCEADAKAAGYTDEQIKGYLQDHPSQHKMPYLKGPAQKYHQESDTTPDDQIPLAPAGVPIPACPLENSKGRLPVSVPAMKVHAARVIQATAWSKLERLDAHRMVFEQKIVNSIGERICLEITMETQKFLHSPAFVAMCDEILIASDIDHNGGLDASELVNAMNAVRSEMEQKSEFDFSCPPISDHRAKVALKDFDLDLNRIIDREEFVQLCKILIIATLLDYDRPHEVAKYCLASQGVVCRNSGGMPPKPLALRPLRDTKYGLPPLQGTLSKGLEPIQRLSRKANFRAVKLTKIVTEKQNDEKTESCDVDHLKKC